MLESVPFLIISVSLSCCVHASKNLDIIKLFSGVQVFYFNYYHYIDNYLNYTNLLIAFKVSHHSITLKRKITFPTANRKGSDTQHYPLKDKRLSSEGDNSNQKIMMYYSKLQDRQGDLKLIFTQIL